MALFDKKTTTSKKAPKAAKVATVSSVLAPAAKKLAAKKTAAPKVTPEERMRMIEQAAYFRAEKAGFQGDPQAHWAAAEAEVDAILSGKAKKK